MQTQLAPMPPSTRRHNEINPVVTIAGAAIAFVIINVAWAIAAAVSDFAPSHLEVLSAFSDLLGDESRYGSLFPMIGSSLERFVPALVIGGIVGGAAGLVSTSSSIARAIVDPLASVLRIAAFIGLPQVLLVTRGLSSSVQIVPTTVAVAATLALAIGRAKGSEGSEGSAIVTNGIRTALAIGWGALMFTETLGSRDGLAATAFESRALLQTDVMVAVSLVAIAIPLILDQIVRIGARLIVDNQR